jgi:uncharacterized membrane protein YhaH (DUF805 family)
MGDTAEELERRHAWVMREHERHIRRSNRRALWVTALCVFVILYSAVVLSLPQPVDGRGDEGHYFAFTLIILAFVVLGLFAVIALLMVSRARAYEHAARLYALAYEVGVLVGRREGPGTAQVVSSSIPVSP